VLFADSLQCLGYGQFAVHPRNLPEIG
jgi:hypothetical protein